MSRSRGSGRLSREELRHLIAVAGESSPRDLALALLLALNGLRISKALEAKIDDMGTERGHRTLKIIRKGGSSAVIPLSRRHCRGS